MVIGKMTEPSDNGEIKYFEKSRTIVGMVRIQNRIVWV